MITQEQLKELLDYDPMTGIFINKVDRSRAKAGSVAGWTTVKGYRSITLLGRQYYAHQLAWLYAYGSFPEPGIDHINHIGTDNRLHNLRSCTVSQNLANRRNLRIGTLKGAHPKGARWRARIKHKQKEISLGHFNTKEEAHAAYCAAAKRIFGEYSCAQ